MAEKETYEELKKELKDAYQRIDTFKKEVDEFQKIINGMLLQSTFIYGMAAAGDPLAIKVLKLTSKDQDQTLYTISMDVKK